jgi:hypothetical protein
MARLRRVRRRRLRRLAVLGGAIGGLMVYRSRRFAANEVRQATGHTER